MLVRKATCAALLVMGLLNGGVCTEIGCVDSFTWETEPVEGWADLAGSTVTLCRNRQCAVGVLPTAEPLTPAVVELTESPDMPGGASVDVSRSGSAFVLDVRWFFPGDASSDIYSGEVSRAGSVILSLPEQTVAYDDVFRPNGELCPPECRRAYRGP